MTWKTRWAVSHGQRRSGGRRRLFTAVLALATLVAVGRPIAQAPVATPDELFKDPYIDIDEWRDAPVRHRYVHGGFKGTDTRFSIYLPPKEQYQGRFFQHITPVPDNENLAQKMRAPGEYNKIGFADRERRLLPRDQRRRAPRPRARRHRGAGQIRPSPPIAPTPRRRSYSRVVAVQMYGGKRPYGYAYGGSRRRLPDGRLDREHDAACGTAWCRTCSARRWRSPTCSPCACGRCGSCGTSSRRSSTRSSRAAAAIPMPG